ncbi:MAG TPA: hypothetical protein VMG82_11570 [Candidatus Sulfotelmatobacter sp.]|nr:hypothetical protein [Candidatus Sulfotelmatobacter sp.]
MQFIDDMLESDIWIIGDAVGKERQKAAIARADLKKESVLATGLSITLTPGVQVPGLQSNHANVGGWPSEKDEQKAIAVELCAQSQLCVRP